MISALILACCIGAAAQFFFAYCRTTLSACDALALSDNTKKIAGLRGNSLDPSEFHRLLGLARMAGVPAMDTAQIRAVKSYYRILSFAERHLSSHSPRALQWIEHELSRCSWFAAVLLDRRLLPAAN